MIDEKLDIKSAKYGKNFEGENASIQVLLNDSDPRARLVVPLDPTIKEYAEIMRQVDAGEITIEEAE